MYYAKLRGTSPTNAMGVPRISTTKGREAMFDIYVDTSASMSKDDLGTVLSQVEPVFRRNMAKIRVWAGDTEVQDLGKAGSLAEVARMLKGGGGTSFVPAFEKWASMPLSERPKTVMFFTDGCGPAPAAPPPGMQVYWILVGRFQTEPWVDGTGKKVDYGKIVRVPELGDK